MNVRPLGLLERTNLPIEPSVDGPPTPAVPTARATRDVSELPSPPEAHDAQFIRTATSAGAHVGTHAMLAMGISVDDVPLPDQDTRIQRGLDAFRQASSPTFDVPGEGNVAVAIAFRMPDCTDEKVVQSNKKALDSVAARLGVNLSGVYFGRATPETVRKLTQGLIDAGKLPPPSPDFPSAAARIRKMMFDCGIGFDCAGYAQQAFLASRGITRAQAGFKPNMLEESLSNLSAPFKKVAPEDARAGDIVVLDPGKPEVVGHRAIVYDRRDLSSREMAVLQHLHGGEALRGRHVVAFQIDASWGAGSVPTQGGVRSGTFLYDTDSHQWAQSDGQSLYLGGSPYGNDVVRGIYRYPVKP